jgi:hypothetical protein
MPSTRTLGITVDAHGQRTINKEYRGERIFLRLGRVVQDDAERRLLAEIDRLELEIERRKHAQPLFSDSAKRFLLESKYKRTASDIVWHVRMFLRHVGHLEVRKVHDETLRPFIDARLAEGVSATTVNRTLEVARAILHRAARAYRDTDGNPWLDTVPPLITMLRESCGWRIPSMSESARTVQSCVGRRRCYGSPRAKSAHPGHPPARHAREATRRRRGISSARTSASDQ